MANGNNQNQPIGFRPFSFIDGSLWTGQTRDYPIASGYSTSLFFGDPVTLLANGTIGIATPGSAVIGVFQGVIYTAADGTPIYNDQWAANTVTLGAANAAAKVADSPNIIFDIQVSTAVGGLVDPVALRQNGQVFNNANFGIAVTSFNATAAPNPVTYAANPGAGNTNTGISGYYLDLNSVGNGATLNCKIMGLTPKPGNAYSNGGTASGTLNFNNALVIFNNHILKGGTGTAGV